MCYLVLIVTASFTPYWRRTVFIILLSWSVYWGDLLAEIPFYTGALLADMSIVLSKVRSIPVSTTAPRFERLYKHWAMALGIFGLFICSYPSNNADLAGWSRAMIRIGNLILHPQCSSPSPSLIVGEHRWAFSLIGSAILIYAIHFSAALRRLFSHPYAVFFGSISFPVYLIHSFLMRSVLVWVVYGIIPEEAKAVRFLLQTAAFLGYLGLVTWLSVIWRNSIDSFCVSITQWIEEVMVGKKTIIDLSSSAFRDRETTKGCKKELEIRSVKSLPNGSYV